MMDLLLLLAAKSLLIAGITLVVLQMMKRRSAADRSWIAHLGLAAIVMLPVASLLFPQVEVATPWLAAEEPAHAAAPVSSVADREAASSAAPFPASGESAPAAAASAPVDWALWAYAAPAALLVLFTLIALFRLILLKSKANVLVEPHWLTALAKAQRRMGFKHGTALLTSDDLRSPISWGLMRPVILLNSEAAEAHGEAEAIIAHELAHVARLDWVKLLLSRVTVALFWFNPLVWMLAREAHQLREEAADDAVLASNIEDTDYARLLVGIARHECRGLLIGAHGVAPGRTSLARRVQRVLNAASQRAPGGWRWTAAAAFFAAGMTVPLAALHLVPTSPAAANAGSVGGKVAEQVAEPASAPSTVAPASAAAAAAAAAADPAASAEPKLLELPESYVLQQSGDASISTRNGRTVIRSHDGSSITIHAPDASGRRRTVLTNAEGKVRTFADAHAVPGLAAATAVAGAATAHPHPPSPPLPPRPPRTSGDAIDRAIELKAVGVTPDYVAAIRRAAPGLRLSHDEIVELRAVGVDPAYLRDLAGAGFTNLDSGDIVAARAMGIDSGYARAMSRYYGRLSMDELVEMKAVGVTPAEVEQFRRAWGQLPSVKKIVSLKALGVTPEELKAAEGR